MDEQGIQTYCFALTASDGSGPRARMEADAFEFVSVEEVASLELAREINGRQLHVLLDLNGHTKGNRLDVIALFCPPAISEGHLCIPSVPISGKDFQDGPLRAVEIGGLRVKAHDDEP